MLQRYIQLSRMSLCLWLVSSLACHADTTGPDPISPDALYTKLTLNHHAVTLALVAPYDTLTLRATSYAATGTPLSDSGTTTYRVTLNGTPDTSVRVSATGVLEAIAPVSGAIVEARHTIGNLTLADTAVVNVNDTTPVPMPAAIRLVFGPGDSTHSALLAPGLVYVVAYVTDEQGDTIPNVVVKYALRNSGQAVLSRSAFIAGRQYIGKLNVGTGAVTVEATVYGRTMRDSVPYTVTPAIRSLIAVVPRFSVGNTTPTDVFEPSDDTVAVGAIVTWVNLVTGQNVDVTFNAPSAILGVDSAAYANECRFRVYNACPKIPAQGGGNITSFAAVDSTGGANGVGVRARQFPTVGTYTYRSMLYGTTGVIHVVQP